MQKIKNALTGNDSVPSSSDRTSREYGSSTAGNIPRDSTTGTGAERLTGDRTATSGTTGTGFTGGNTATSTTGSGLTGNGSSTLSGSNAGVQGAGRGIEPHSGSGFTGNARDSTASGYSTGSGLGNSGITSTGTTGNRLTGDSDAKTGLTSGTSGTGSGGRFSTAATNFKEKHDIGHDSSLASKFDPSAETTHHDHKHLQHVTHRDVRHLETEEVIRDRQHERHVHHIQHHVQPIHHQEMLDEVHHEKSHPITRINEHHVNTDEDHQLFRGLGEKHRDQETHRPKERTIVDMGERVNEVVHHHVHHITQPVVKQEVHERHRVHTVIPTHHVTHEAPIIHKSSLHEPIGMADFKKGGGVLGSGITMDNANVLQTGECSREVDGVGEKLAQELHLGSGTTRNTSGSGLGSSGNYGSSGLTSGNSTGLTSGNSATSPTTRV